jgi:hypothetical protein
MRLWLGLLLVLPPWHGALALNWEGHDDWMAELPAAVDLDRAHPVDPPRAKLKPCAKPANSYDQVPLPGRNCLDPTPSPVKAPEAVR